MHLLRDPDELSRLIERNGPPGFMAGIDPSEWLVDPRHFAIVEGDDLGLFEAGDEWPGPLCAHVLFKSRGRQVIDTARAMLDQAFSFGATRILGETPERYRHALMFARLLGFAPYGVATRDGKRIILSELKTNPKERRLVA
jgi:hypothetical protein